MNEPRFAVGEATTRTLSFDEDLTAYREAGIEGIGIVAGSTGVGIGGLDEGTVTEQLARFRDSGLTATLCFPKVQTIHPFSLSPGSHDPATRIEQICEGMRLLAAFEPVCVGCGPGPYAGREPERAREEAAAGLRQVARAAADVGVTVALEPMHASMSAEWSFVTTIPEAMELLRAIDEPNVGLIVDVWHLWDTPNVLRHIRENVAHIVGVHVNDWRDPTRSWCDRVLPGDGIGDVPAFLGALDQAGYDGWVELEVFSDDGTYGNDFPDSLWKWDPVELVRVGRAKFLEAWGARRPPAA